MIISQTPFRYSFVGGGTDLKKFYINEPGQVLSTTINKYLYVVIRRQTGVIESKYRINWSKIELKNKLEDIEQFYNPVQKTKKHCKKYVRTDYHPSGTAKMGADNDKLAVLDSKMRVRGINNLRVCDLSAVPNINSGNTSAPAMMLGLRCGDLILDY